MKNQSKRLSILSLPEAKELYSVPQFSSHEREYFFSLTDEELAAVNRINSYRNRIHLVLMLGYFKVKHVCLIYGWKEINEDYRYVAERYFPKANKQNKNLSRQDRSRLYNTLLGMNDYQRCDESIELELLSHLEKRAMCYVDEAQLFKDAVSFLKLKQVAIPGYSTLQKHISNAINTEENRLSILVRKHLKKPESFLNLIDHQNIKYGLNNLKKLSKTYKPGENKKELGRHDVLSILSDDAFNLMNKLGLSEGNIRYFATRCQNYDIHRLRELNKGKALLYLVCFAAIRFRISNDSLTLSFLVAYKDFYDKSKEYRDECVKQQALTLLKEIEKVPLLLDLFTDKGIQYQDAFGIVQDRAFDIIPEKQLLLVRQKMAKTKLDKEIFRWEFVDKNFAQVVRNIRPLLKALDIGCRNNTVLQQQIHNVKSALESKELSPQVDGRLVKTNDKKYLTDVDSDDLDKKTIANRNELYLYKLLYDAIRNGDSYVKNSLEYSSFDDYLVDDRVWTQRNKYLVETGLDWMTESPDDYFSELEIQFNERMHAVGQRISEGKNTYIKRKSQSDSLLWSKAVTPKNDVLTENFFANFDRKTIVNILRKVNTETGFLDHLKPETNRHKKSSASIENLLACIIANGTFQGTHKFSVISDQQYKVLKRIEDECLHSGALQEASDAITGAAVRLPIFEDFNLDDGQTHSSADGQRFESKYSNPLVGRSAKYYASKNGAIVYTLVASHFAMRGKVIPPRSHESHYLFDIVYNNTSDLKANIVSTDTHGTNQFNHAILNAFGYQFSPRYAGFKRKFLTEFTVDFNDENIISLIKPINWKLIKSEWHNITKILLSLGMRTVQQSTLVKKLCQYKQHNSTMLAFAEYNRIFQCLHMLEYADDKQLRQVIQESLNRGESLQGLKRALAALGGNQFRGRSPEEMDMWNSCANLLANCIVYYNALIMSSYKSYCMDTGNEGQIKHLGSISPASWENVILNGHYDLTDDDDHWDIESKLENIKLAA